MIDWIRVIATTGFTLLTVIILAKASTDRITAQVASLWVLILIAVAYWSLLG